MHASKIGGCGVFLCATLFVSSLLAQERLPEIDTLRVVKYNDLEEEVYRRPEPLTVLYFWATWCGPCVRKIHHLEELRQAMKKQDVRVMLVSVDKVSRLQKVKDLIKSKDLRAEALLLDEAGNYDTLIDRINPKWGGAIPYTMLIRNKKMVTFHEGSLSKEKLFALVEKNL